MSHARLFALGLALMLGRAVVAVELSPTPTLLYDSFPTGGQGMNGVRCQSRDLVTNMYIDLTGSATVYNTPGAPFGVPSVFLIGPRLVMCHPSAILQGMSRRDAVYRVRLDGCGFASVRIEATTGRNPQFTPTVTWYVYVGETNWASPLFTSSQLNTPIDLTIPFFDGMEVFFATNAGVNDFNDNAGFMEPRVTGMSATPCRPDLTTSATAGSRCYGVPNGVITNEDFFYYLTQFAAGNAAVADLTNTALPGSPGYGVPNGIVSNDDFFFYLTLFAARC
ncbi:MAG: GC-type dockerin domain-anchored protein [Phycisphaerales bacterium]